MSRTSEAFHCNRKIGYTFRIWSKKSWNRWTVISREPCDFKSTCFSANLPCDGQTDSRKRIRVPRSTKLRYVDRQTTKYRAVRHWIALNNSPVREQTPDCVSTASAAGGRYRLSSLMTQRSTCCRELEPNWDIVVSATPRSSRLEQSSFWPTLNYWH